jgi:hypothetical protein
VEWSWINLISQKRDPHSFSLLPFADTTSLSLPVWNIFY